MAELLAPNGNRLLWEFVYPNGEFVQFGMYTGMRDAAQHAALATEMKDFVDNIGDGVAATNWIAGWLSYSVKIQEWQNPIFSDDYWGTVYDEGVLVANTQGVAPAQISCVLSVITTDNELPVRRRRNRSYLGRIFYNRLGSADGLFNSASVTNLGTAVQTFKTSLEGVPLKAGVNADFDGLCVVSYRGTAGPPYSAQIAKADVVRIGLVPDTQRRRRNGLPESYDDFPV